MTVALWHSYVPHFNIKIYMLCCCTLCQWCSCDTKKKVSNKTVQTSRRWSVDTLLLNGELGWAARLSVLVGGFARVSVAAAGANFGQDQGACAIFLILDLSHGCLHHRLVTAEPDHLRVGVSCKDKPDLNEGYFILWKAFFFPLCMFI